jgi:alanyl-tRNA synthetase
MDKTTARLYRLDSYMKEFDAVVDRVGDNYVILDRTCFFPRGGGQAGDTGRVAGVRVIDTLSEEGDIKHITEANPPFGSGQSIHCELDWERRFRIMRLHSASHLVYYVMQEVFGSSCKPLSSGMLDEAKDRSDYAFNEPLDKAKLSVVEDRVNGLIMEALPIAHAPDPNEGGKFIWKVSPFPEMACGGTHVKNTLEIGRIALRRGSKPGKGRERIEVSLV